MSQLKLKIFLFSTVIVLSLLAGWSTTALASSNKSISMSNKYCSATFRSLPQSARVVHAGTFSAALSFDGQDLLFGCTYGSFNRTDMARAASLDSPQFIVHGRGDVYYARGRVSINGVKNSATDTVFYFVKTGNGFLRLTRPGSTVNSHIVYLLEHVSGSVKKGASYANALGSELPSV
jgi:hypothetical protein